jgi:hypothetical protein
LRHIFPCRPKAEKHEGSFAFVGAECRRSKPTLETAHKDPALRAKLTALTDVEEAKSDPSNRENASGLYRHVQWNQRVTKRVMQDGQRTKSRVKGNDAYILTKGVHEPIIEEALFHEVQALFAAHAKRPLHHGAKMQNPLAGWLYAACAAANMLRKQNYGYDRADALVCVTQNCPTAGTYIPVVETAILDTLHGWVNDYERYTPKHCAGMTKWPLWRKRRAQSS